MYIVFCTLSTMILQLPNSQLTKDFFVTLYNRSFLACLTSLIDNLKLFSVSSSLSDIFFSLTFLQTTLPLIERFICHGIADKSRHNCWTKESVWHKDFYVWNGMFRVPTTPYFHHLQNCHNTSRTISKVLYVSSSFRGKSEFTFSTQMEEDLQGTYVYLWSKLRLC